MEFERHAAGGSNMHYFDLLVRLKTEQEHLFRNIQRNEYHNLFDFIRSAQVSLTLSWIELSICYIWIFFIFYLDFFKYIIWIFYIYLPCNYWFSGKGLKIMNLGDMKTTDGVAAVLQEDDDDAVDPHLERIKNEAGGDESDEEVNSSIHFLKLLLMKFADASAKFILFVHTFVSVIFGNNLLHFIPIGKIFIF